MKNYLYRLGQWSFINRWRVIAAWVMLLLVTGVLAFTYAKPMTTSLSIPGVEAQITTERFNEIFPNSGTSSGRIVFQATNGNSIDDYYDVIEEVRTDIESLPEVTAAQFEPEFTVSDDNTVGFINVELSSDASGPSEEVINGAANIADRYRSDNLNVEVGGDLNSDNPGNIIGIGEIIGLAVAIGVLMATFGAIVAAGMPVLAALLTVGISMAALFSLSEVMDINTTTPALAVMLGLAVGIDYSLFIINRYRAFRRDGEKPLTAIGHTTSTAGNAVIFAAATVVIALSALAVVNIPFMTTMGLTAAFTVALAALISITFVPALIGLAGPTIFSTSQRKSLADGTQKRSRDPSSFWHRWGENLIRFRFPILVLSLGIIAAMAWPAADLQLGLPSDETSSRDSSRYKAAIMLKEGFGAGYNGPLLALVEELPSVSESDREAVRQNIESEINQRIEAESAAAMAKFESMLQAATTPEQVASLQQEFLEAQIEGRRQIDLAKEQVDGQVEQFAKFRQATIISEQIAQIDGVEAAQVFMTNADGSAAAIQVVPTTGPNDEKTSELVRELREGETQSNITASGAKLSVTGSTAMRIDINQRLSEAMPTYLSVVIGLSLVLLLIAFRSVIIPIKATLGFLLSLAAMLGALVAVFQWGWLGITDAPGPIVSFLPIIGIGILFGLAMDYEFFLVSSMHEVYSKTKDARRAVVDGFAIGSRVVLAAGLIMVSVFSGFVASHDNTIQALGFALAIGILIDALIVRMTILPIVMSMLGDRAWWLPKWLDKILPKVNID